jgi:hypothetical protein
MKKIFALLLIVSVLTSCEQEVSFNTPAFQARKDNFMWRAKDYTARYDTATSTLQLSAFVGFEKLTMTVTPVEIVGDATGAYFQNGTFNLSNNPDALVIYSYVNNGQTYKYSTAIEDTANGEVSVENGAIQKPGTISGSFRFDAPYVGEIPNAPERINFQNGVFYEIPITFGPIL